MRAGAAMLTMAALLAVGAGALQSGDDAKKGGGLFTDTPPNSQDRDDNANVQQPATPAFTATVSFDGEKESFDHPAKAMGVLRRIVRLRRAGGHHGDFAALLTINGSSLEFDEPKDAQEACRAVHEAMRAAQKEGLEFAELGKIQPVAEVVPEDLQGSRDQPPERQLTPQQANFIVRQRISEALAASIARSRGRFPSPRSLQGIVDREIQKAVEEGLISSASQAGVKGGAWDSRRIARIESIRIKLQQALAKVSQPPPPEPPDNAADYSDSEQ